MLPGTAVPGAPLIPRWSSWAGFPTCPSLRLPSSSRRILAELARLLYSLSEGGSTSMSAIYPVIEKSGSWAFSLAVAIPAGVVQCVSSYCFQGSSILEAIVGPHTDDDVVGDDFIPRSPSLRTQFFSGTTQFAYLMANAGKDYIDRYFLLTAILESLNITLSSQVFYGILLPEWILKLLFGLTNESYETADRIAKRFIPGSEPFYKKALKPLSGRIARNILRVAGAFSHALVDDIIMWAPLYLSSGASEYLLSSDVVPRVLLTLASLLGVSLACSLFTLVYLFEGKHTEEVLKRIAGDLSESDPRYFPDIIIKYFQFMIKYTSPIIHGLSSATSYLYAFKEMINGFARLPVSIGLAGLSLILTTMGTYFSEAREALAELEKMRRPERAVPPPSARGENVALLTHRGGVAVAAV